MDEDITVRRHPRSMAEAFPQDHGHAVEIYRKPIPNWFFTVVGLTIAVLMLGVVVAWKR